VRFARAAFAGVALAALAAAPAAAQSRRYPKPPVDAEAEAEAKSDFWEEVVRPGARRYEDTITAATDSLRINRTGDASRPRDQLRDAVALRPDLVEGWGYLGHAAERTRDWKLCAEAYGRAFAIDPTWRPTRIAARSEIAAPILAQARRPLELGWAVCLSRIGDYPRAITALEALVARGETSGEAWLRLGEVYMAEGRLAEAITALDQARTDAVYRVYARWLLAVAYDRARRPAEAEAIAAETPDVENTARIPIPFVPAADVYYVRAFAKRHSPERAIALYRAYLEQAPPDSPWRTRAREHLDTLAETDLATRVDIEGHGDRAVIERTTRAALPALRACVADVPTVLLELRVTQIGPAGRPAPPPRPVPARELESLIGRPRPGPGRVTGPGTVRPGTVVVPLGRRPPDAQTPGVSATALEGGDKLDPRYLAAIDCVEKVGLSLTLPRPAPGTYSTVRIPVVAIR
jgi:tetratricopeptide (TPR) repeat protein